MNKKEYFETEKGNLIRIDTITSIYHDSGRRKCDSPWTIGYISGNLGRLSERDFKKLKEILKNRKSK